MEENVYEFFTEGGDNPTVFSFYSIGLTTIKKIVSFEHEVTFADRLLVYNLILGDELEDGSGDAEVNSNNGDIFKVLDTVAEILKYFLGNNSNEVAVYIKGADDRRINVYHWKIKRALDKSSINYKIFGQKQRHGPFEKMKNEETYIGFLVIPQG